MKKQDGWLRIVAGLMIGFLAVYSGCLVWSGTQDGKVAWAEELRIGVIRTCMKLSAPVVSVTQQESGWKEQAWELLAEVLNWPFVVPESESIGSQPVLSAQTEPSMPRTQVSHASVGNLGQPVETEEVPSSEVTETADEQTVEEPSETAAESSAEDTEIEVPSEATVAETQPAADDGQAVSMAATVSLLPTEGQVRPEIQALPAINQLSYEQFFDYGYLLNRLYVVNRGCTVNEEILNPRRLLSKNLTISHEGEDYQILIYHTHSQEAFADSVPGDISQTVVGLGNYLTEQLEERGYRVLHDTGIYDMENGVPERDHAYERALPMLEQTLAEHPGIQVVIDLHRDGVAEDVHLVSDVNGAQTARLMFFNGMCRDENGERSDVSNPYREDCLAFSLQAALQLEAYYPGMLRVVYLKQNRYNQHLRGRSMLAEVGAQTNTVEEAYRAIPVLADVLARLLQ